MNYKFKNWLYILISILVIGVVATLAIKLLVYLIPVLIVVYIILKVKEYIERKNNISSKRRNEFQYRPDYDVKIDNSNGEVIDVDYEDVNK